MKLLILDGNSVINRAYYGVRLLTTRDGQYTNAIYGFLNILEKLEKEEKPDAVCVAFDLHGPTFRHNMYDGYKATRHPMPEELAQQMPVMKEILGAMNIPVFQCQGWEADDVIGTVGRICGIKGWDCVIATGDRDSLQLIDEHVSVKLVISKPGQTTATLFDSEKFIEEYGFDPPKMVDLKALMGDSSDNIPGVAGVGPKTATELLLKFGSLDGVYENLHDPSIRPKLREKLENGKDSAYLSYDLATIRTNAPIDFDPESTRCKDYDKPQLYKLFQKLEFVKLIDKYGLRDANLFVPSTSAPVEQLPEADGLPDRCEAYSIYFAPDGSVGIAWKDGVYVMTPMELMWAESFLEVSTGAVCHDLKTTLHLLDKQGICCKHFVFDTALAAYNLNPSSSDYSVSKLATNYLGISVDDNDPAGCAQAIWYLHSVLKQELEKNQLIKLYEEIDYPLCSVLFRMEKAGVAIDSFQLEQFGHMLSQRVADCEALIFSYSGGPFNINSPKQLGDVLFEQLGLPPDKKTKKGYATNADVLKKLEKVHPIIPAIMDYRMLTKLKSTYADGLMKVIEEDGRIHTTFQNLVTATGRLSSTEPNLQNIPIRTDLGAEIRKMFIPKPGYVLVDADYSQIELRVLAHIADDKDMQDAFLSGVDIHSATASQVFGVSVDAVTPLQRRNAKAVNFGIVYGMSEFTLADEIDVSRYEAKRYIESYLAHYHGVRTYMKNVVEDARVSGFTTTMYGRRRYVPELKSSNFNIRSGAQRVAMNTPIQGSAADLIKLAMVRVDKMLRTLYPRAQLILQVHDELIVECPEEIAQQVSELVSKEMENVAVLNVPLIAEANWGKSWFEAK